MREVGWVELAAMAPPPVVRHDVDPRRFVRAWTEGGAVVVEQRGGWPDARATGAALLCVGSGAALAELVGGVAVVVPRAWRVVVEAGTEAVLPAGWRIAEPRAWHWMIRDTAPSSAPSTFPSPVPSSTLGALVVEEVGPQEAAALVRAANPASSALRVRDDVECRLGVREDGRLVAVGSLARRASGSGHLTGVAVLPQARGRGLGGAVTLELARRAFDAGRGPATLGVYTDNLTAVDLYRRLGFVSAHTLVSGLVG